MPTLFRNTFYTSLSQGWQMLMAVVLFKAATVGLGESIRHLRARHHADVLRAAPRRFRIEHADYP